MQAPFFYMMTPAFGAKEAIDVICISNNANMNCLLNYRRINPKVAFISITEEQAKAFLDTVLGGAGIGYYLVTGDPVVDRGNRAISRIKAWTFGKLARGFKPLTPVPLQLVKEVRERKPILRLIH